MIFGLGPGTHRITARACRSSTGSELCATDTVTIEVVDVAPHVVITVPAADGETFTEGLPVAFSAQIAQVLGAGCERLVWSGDIDPSQGNPTGCSVLLRPAHRGVNRIRFTATRTDGGPEGFAERMIIAGEATGLTVRIVEPAPNTDDGRIFIWNLQLAPLRAEIVNPLNTNIETVGWFFNRHSTGEILPVAEGLSTTWAPRDICPARSCGGMLSVIIVDELGNIAGQGVEVVLQAPIR